MRPYSRVYATVDLDAVAYNMEQMQRNLTPGTKMIGVVKADAYGHGSVPVARACDAYVWGYAVATAEEALLLRRHGIEKPVIILGTVHESAFIPLIEQEIRIPVFTKSQAVRLSEAAVKLGKDAILHLVLDTGMGRIGMMPSEESVELVEEIAGMPNLVIEGMFTHFARADECDKAPAKKQLDKYLHMREMLGQRGIQIPISHCSNSAGIIDIQEANLDLVRAGISIYGMYPSDEVDKKAVSLKPVMGLKSSITYIKQVDAGTQISYGGTFQAQQPMMVATVPVGYGDGYPRNLSGRGWVLIHGKKAPILGRVCMDQFMVDVTDIPEACEDDEVTLIGADGSQTVSVEDLARLGGGFHYEIVCDIGKRVPRVYLRDGKIVGTKDYFDDVFSDF